MGSSFVELFVEFVVFCRFFFKKNGSLLGGGPPPGDGGTHFFLGQFRVNFFWRFVPKKKAKTGQHLASGGDPQSPWGVPPVQRTHPALCAPIQGGPPLPPTSSPVTHFRKEGKFRMTKSLARVSDTAWTYAGVHSGGRTGSHPKLYWAFPAFPSLPTQPIQPPV